MLKRLTIIFICLLILLTSCIATAEREYYSDEITYSEPGGQYSFRMKMDVTETESVKYFFEPNIKSDERESCIEVTEKILSNLSLDSTTLGIYIFSQNRYSSKYISDHKLYCTIQNWKSIEYITDVLLAVYEKTAHYGTAIGYANYLSRNYKWENVKGSFSSPSVNDILDLNYLCFDERFVSYKDLVSAEEIACDFVDSYINKHGEKAIQQLLTSHIKTENALLLYYKDHGVYYTPSPIQYGYGGASYDYLVYSDCGTFYVSKGWIDTNAEYNPLIGDGFLHSNYTETKTFFQTNIKQMQLYQELFNLDDYNNDLDIIFTKPISASKYSFYQSANHRIYVYNVDSLMHEYIHALTMPKTSMASWQVEGFARYFSYYYDFYGISFLNQDYNNTPNTPATKWIYEYLATINRPIDMARDYRELENLAVYSRSYADPNANYLAGASFVQYLVNQYGEDAVINNIYGNGAPLPKSYDELIKDWNEFIERNYSSYSKYQ